MISKLKKRLWKEFSEHVRRKAGGVCYTCGYKDHWRKMHCAHFIKASVANTDVYFSEINNKSCCEDCNNFKGGNLDVFEEKLKKEYGPEIINKLHEMNRSMTKWDREDYANRIKFYKALNRDDAKQDWDMED